MSETLESFVDLGETVCGQCGGTFDDENPPHSVDRRRVEASGECDYPESAPWHERCITEANAYLVGKEQS
jgi:hypothetical protein